MPQRKKSETKKVGEQLQALQTKTSRSNFWKGPSVDGITFSLLSRFLVDRERFRLYAIEGLRPAEGFNHRLGYGTMWHICEESLASTGAFNSLNVAPHPIEWETPLRNYCRRQCQLFPTQQQLIDHWYNVCKVQFPIYVDYWRAHADVASRIPVFQEKKFRVGYMLPSKRVVVLRGKWDAVDIIGAGSEEGVFIQENKTKGDIAEDRVVRQLSFDLQTMLYVIAFETEQNAMHSSIPGRAQDLPIKGVRYNAVRRPLSGGKGTIRQHKPSKSKPAGESKIEFYKRLGDEIASAPSEYFMRWKVVVDRNDVMTFRRQCLDPLLEYLCDWWEWVTSVDDPFSNGGNHIHWRHPFGVYNVLDEGGASEFDVYLATGSKAGLEKVSTLFPELED